MDKEDWALRAANRRDLSPEERQLAALEDIADSLWQMVDYLRNISER